MADPISMIAVGSMAATAIGGGVTAMGQLQGGAAAKAMYDYRARIAQENAKYETALGERKAGELGMRQRAQAGQIKAAQGASGLDVSRGSAVEVQKSQGEIARIEQEDVRYSAARRAYGEETQAGLYTAAGKQAKTASYYEAAGTVLGSAGSVSDKWLQARSTGLLV
jgi:hypothetical protein